MQNNNRKLHKTIEERTPFKVSVFLIKKMNGRTENSIIYR